VALRLTDEVGYAVLDWVAAGDVSASAALDQHVATVRAALAGCGPDEPSTARMAGLVAGEAARPDATRSERTRPDAARLRAAPPHHARRSGTPARPPASRVSRAHCPDTPFADTAWYTDEAPPLRLLLHYACGFVEAAVRADWWPGETVSETASEAGADAMDFEGLRLAAVCQLIRQAELAAAQPPDFR
jgi:Family of unknown function (DUF6401)